VFVQILDCRFTQITKLENLPIGLQELHCNRYTILFVDNIPKETINFTLKGYNAIKRIQKRMKWRYKRKRNAARIICNGCHNWVWKPLCRDGTIGIRPRLDMISLGII